MLTKPQKSVPTAVVDDHMGQISVTKRPAENTTFGIDLLSDETERWMLSKVLGSADCDDHVEPNRSPIATRRKMVRTSQCQDDMFDDVEYGDAYADDVLISRRGYTRGDTAPRSQSNGRITCRRPSENSLPREEVDGYANDEHNFYRGRHITGLSNRDSRPIDPRQPRMHHGSQHEIQVVRLNNQSPGCNFEANTDYNPPERVIPNRPAESFDARIDSPAMVPRQPRGISMGQLGGMGGIIPESFSKKPLQIQLGKIAPNTAVRNLTVLLRGNWPGPYSTWSGVPPGDQIELWGKYKKLWYVAVEEDAVYLKAFHKSMSERYRSILSIARRDALRSSKSSNIVACIDHKPKWMKERDWMGLIMLWGDNDWQVQSSTNQKNRLTEKEGGVGKHSGGSVSFAEHSMRMAAELGRPPTPEELFMQMHRGKSEVNKFIDRRAQHVLDSYQALMLDKYETPEAVELAGFDLSVWKRATGSVRNKGWIYEIIQNKKWDNHTAVNGHDGQAARSEQITTQVRSALDEFREEWIAEIANAVLAKMNPQPTPCLDNPNTEDDS